MKEKLNLQTHFTRDVIIKNGMIPSFFRLQISIYIWLAIADIISFLNMQESWAICRIFKKTNATAQRALSHSWVSPLPETTTTSDHRDGNQLCQANMPFTKKTSLASQFYTFNHNESQHSTTTSTTPCPLDVVAS